MVALEAVLDLQVVEVAKVEEEVEGREKRTGLPHKVGSKMAQMKPELVEAKKQTVLKKNTPVNTQEKNGGCTGEGAGELVSLSVSIATSS